MSKSNRAHRLKFQKQAAANSPYGGVAAGWADQFTCWGWIDFPPPSNEKVIAQHLEGQQPATIKVRYDAATTALVGSDWRAVHERGDGITDFYALKSGPRRLDGDMGHLYVAAMRGAPDGG